MTSQELKQKYFDFFQSKKHSLISGSSLIPENDPTVLFITAGMQPLIPYLLGEKHPAGRRLVSVQKCLRTIDIDQVGDDTHSTFFQMLGNWSLGDYFKKEAIEWSLEFLTSPQYLNLDQNLLAVSVFAGDQQVPVDQESAQIWKKLGISEERIAHLPRENNWWGPAGETGPCGPDTEIFYWTGDPQQVPSSFNDDHELWVEIWNNVFMEYNKVATGKYELLKQKNVDTGLGFLRILTIVNGFQDIYETDLLQPLIKKIEEISGHQYQESPEVTKAMRIIVDHLKAAILIIGDEKGVVPTNTDQGYIVRRLIRRALRYAHQLGIKQKDWLADFAQLVIKIYQEFFNNPEQTTPFIIQELITEEEKFTSTLQTGLKEFNKLSGDLSGQQAFKLYQTYGFPLEMIEELAQEKKIKVDRLGFEQELKKHQELSRTAAAGKFKGGLADVSEETTKLHTTAHLLLAALRKVLGPGVLQRGSNITPERLRLDFSYSEKLSPVQLQEVENLVNEAIRANYQVFQEELSLAEAQQRGAMGVFTSKYGERVKVYTITNLDSNGQADIKNAFSQEICGGPHVQRTGALGTFKIKKESSSSAGVRRIKAVLEN